MSIKVILRKEELSAPAPATVGETLRALGLPPEQYLVVYNGSMVDETQPLQDGDTIRLVAVISGGGSEQ